MLKALIYLCSCMPLRYSVAQINNTRQELSAANPADSTGLITDISCSLAARSGIIITWKLSGKSPDFFSIERSDDGKSFETVTVLNNVGSKPQYQWTDEAAGKGKSFYRVRYSFEAGQNLYSTTVACMGSNNASSRFYPNPVDQILIIRSDAPIDVQITDANGKPRITEPRVQGLHTINVSSLEKGIYLIRFTNKLTNVISQEKLVKN